MGLDWDTVWDVALGGAKQLYMSWLFIQLPVKTKEQHRQGTKIPFYNKENKELVISKHNSQQKPIKIKALQIKLKINKLS